MDIVMTSSNIGAKALSFAFGTFKPSDRRRLLEAANSGDSGELLFVEALVVYLEGWANADWLEEYNVERIGQWIAANCSSTLTAKVLATAESRKGGGSAIRHMTYSAVLNGIHSTTSRSIGEPATSNQLPI
jgi:hypothetical protein